MHVACCNLSVDDKIAIINLKTYEEIKRINIKADRAFNRIKLKIEQVKADEERRQRLKANRQSIQDEKQRASKLGKINLNANAITVVNNDWRSRSTVVNGRSVYPVVNKVCESSSLVDCSDLKILCDNDADKNLCF